MTNAAYATHGQFRPAGPQSPDQALFDDVAAFLKEQGFVEEGRYNVAHTAEGTPIQADFLFHRNHAVG